MITLLIILFYLSVLTIPAHYFNTPLKKHLTFVIFAIIIAIVADAAMAQVVEHILGKDEVGSSSLPSSSKKKKHFVRSAFSILCNKSKPQEPTILGALVRVTGLEPVRR